MEYGVSFAASFEAVAQARRAEALGFSFIGFYDSPALEPDVWITIANAAQATRRIQVGVEVLIPHLRHPMAQASAIATIEQLAPGRLYVGVGTGFTGRKAMGQRALPWAYVADFIATVKALLAGEEAIFDGGATRMLHPPGFAPARPIRTPFLFAANGPKGVEVARRLGDGLIYGGMPEHAPRGFAMLQLGLGGVLLDEGESASSPRVIEASKQGFALQYHLAYEGYFNPPLTVGRLPAGDDWLRGLEDLAEDKRHLAVHADHMVAVNRHDAAFIERHPELLAEFAASGAVTPAKLAKQAERRPAGAPASKRSAVATPDSCRKETV
jgi:5,10-methylenetetrahydromethanopterin reductase